MAEYIERQKVITKISRWLLDRETKGNYAVLRNMLDDIPTADVVERSKIDKAIEEINEIPVLFYELPLGKTQVVRKDVVLAIIERNTGERGI